MMKITEEQLNTLNQINNALGNIYTKGEESVILVKCRITLSSIIDSIYEENPKVIKISEDENKEE